LATPLKSAAQPLASCPRPGSGAPSRPRPVSGRSAWRF